ncbi:MAG: C40 family peptidase [Campylobacteraceae bacterium]|nr:C40 family peptidase [Campylobacteraceae bacterium]
MKYTLFTLLTCLFFLSGCAQKEVIPPIIEKPKMVQDDTPKRNQIIKNALTHLNKKDGLDCSGFVSLVNKESGESYFNNQELNEHFEDSRRSLAIYNLLEDNKRTFQDQPRIGDLIFFANTLKKYAKTKSEDNITHIGIVTKIDDDKTVHFIHHTKGKNMIGYINQSFPEMALSNGKVVNSYMEKCSSNNNKCLAPAYFSAYGTIK